MGNTSYHLANANTARGPAVSAWTMPVILAWEVAQGAQDGVQFLPDTHPDLGDSYGAAFHLLWFVPHCVGANRA